MESDSPEAAIDDEKDGDEEGGHLAGVDQGVRPVGGGGRGGERKRESGPKMSKSSN